MTRNPDILFITEYIKNVLYFATVRQGRDIESTKEAHYFSIDSQLIYENYYSDFGPLNLGCVYKYCKILNDKLKEYLNKQIIVHYTSIDPKKKANSAFLLGCYGVLYLSLPPKDALKPLLIHGQNYRPFQDASQGDSRYTICLLDCLQAIVKARDLGFFNFQDFNYAEYDRLDKIQGGDLNWIIPGKFLAFIGPVDSSVSLYHPPEMYVGYFLENNVRIVIRLNKKLYDGNVFSDVGITHYDLFFPDGSCPPRHILMKFLQISEKSNTAIAVHCKAGLGRTGSLIGCYLIKHYRMSAHEAIAWMRICRPGSVIGQQQEWLEDLQAWLLKQGNLYRKRMWDDINKIPTHEFGVYSIAEKTHKQKPVVFSKSPSPPPPMQRQPRSEVSQLPRPQASKHKEDKSENEDEETFITSCDLTVQPTEPQTQLKGCVIKNSTITDSEEGDLRSDGNRSLWRKYLCCRPCMRAVNDNLWMLAVRCAKVTPKRCHSSKCCSLIDAVTPHKTAEKFDWNVKVNSPKVSQKGDQPGQRRGSGAGEPRGSRTPSRSNTARSQGRYSSAKTNDSSKNSSVYNPVPTFRTSEGPVMKNVTDAKNFLMRSSIYSEQRHKHLNSAMTVTPQYSFRLSNLYNDRSGTSDVTKMTPSTTGTKYQSQTQGRRRLGRSPSPSPMRYATEQTRATNTLPPSSTTERFLARDSTSALSAALSRLKLSGPRDSSIGAASLGARRDAPAARQAPSVRSDERPLATQGDMLNSIKFQRRFRETLNADKINFHGKTSLIPKEKTSIRNIYSSSTANKPGSPPNQDFSPKDRGSPSRNFFNQRPSSPKGRRSQLPLFDHRI